jgi:mono/diheme cytochrome c family protein
MRLTLVFVVSSAVILLAQAPAGPTRSVWDGVYSPEQAGRGQTLYMTHCAPCHMPELEGRLADPTGTPTGVPGLQDPGFQSKWNGLTLGDLWERIRISMPQEKPGSLSRQINADILAYILQRNALPAGVEELPPEKERLDAIRIEH